MLWLSGNGVTMPCSGFDYIVHIFSTTLKDAVTAFKGARLFSPHKVQEIQPSASSVDSLTVFPFFDQLKLSDLKAEHELPAYLAKSMDIAPTVCPLQWWRTNASELPHWSTAAQKVVLLQPSSAASERVFSLLNNCFSKRQDSSLSDYVEALFMLQYNKW